MLEIGGAELAPRDAIADRPVVGAAVQQRRPRHGRERGVETLAGRDHLRPGTLAVLALDELPRTPAVDERGAVTSAGAARRGSRPHALRRAAPLPLELLQTHRPVERLQTRSPLRPGVPWPPPSGSAAMEAPNAASTCGGGRIYAVRAARLATISASTVVSAGIASSRSTARAADSSASRRASSTPCTAA